MTDIGTSEAIAQVDDVTSLWVIVRSNKNLYGFDANLVGNMIALPKVTHVPESIKYMAGTITVRGSVIPLIDLRVYTGQPSADQEVEDFCALMDQRLADHKNWLRELTASVEEKREFKLTTDPHMCAFGKWYDGYKTENRMLASILAKFDIPHKCIHAIAKEVTDHVAKGELDEAHKVIEQTEKKDLQVMIGLFTDIQQAARDAVRRRIAMVLELDKRTLALDIDEVVAVENISKIDPSPHQHTRDLGISRVGRREKDDELVLLMEDLDF